MDEKRSEVTLQNGLTIIIRVKLILEKSVVYLKSHNCGRDDGFCKTITKLYAEIINISGTTYTDIIKHSETT